MMRTPSGMKMLTKLMFRLLPVQILLAAVGSVNSIEQHTIGIRMVYRMAKKSGISEHPWPQRADDQDLKSPRGSRRPERDTASETMEILVVGIPMVNFADLLHGKFNQ